MPHLPCKEEGDVVKGSEQGILAKQTVCMPSQLLTKYTPWAWSTT